MEPTRKDRMRPLEYLGIAGGFAVFSGLVILLSTREPIIAAIAFGVIFIVALMTLALLALAMKPEDAELDELDEANKDAEGPKGHE